MILKHTSDQRTERIRFGWFTELLTDATLLKKTATQNLAISGGNMTALRNAISKLEMALSELKTLNSSGAISIDKDEHCKFMLYFLWAHNTIYPKIQRYFLDQNLYTYLLMQFNMTSIIAWKFPYYSTRKWWIFQRQDKILRFVFVRSHRIWLL